MNNDLSVLMISYHFPPSAAIGGKRVARFSRYLPEFGIRPIVVTIDETSCEAIDQSFPIPDQLKVERVPPRQTILNWYQRRAVIRNAAAMPQESSNGGGGRNRKNGNQFLKNHVLAALQFPDRNRGWYRPAVDAAGKVIANSHVDVVFSSGPPWTTHAVAHTISRRYKLPWIADFRDAWVCDAWRKYAGWPSWRDRLDYWAEDRWIRSAACVVCTTDRHREALLSEHAQLETERVVTIPNGFDDKQERACPVEPVVNDGRRILLHAGELYGGRRVGPFCRAVEILAEAGQISSDACRVTFLGDTDADVEREARSCAPGAFGTGMIEFRARVDWDRAQQALAKASVLLLFQGDHPTAVPAKFFECLRTGKPILAIAKDGALKDLVVRTCSGVVADPDNTDEIALAIKQAIAMRPRAADEVEKAARPFHFRNLTADLAANIRRVVPTS